MTLMKRRRMIKTATSTILTPLAGTAAAQSVPPAEHAAKEAARKNAFVAGSTVLVTGANRGIGLGFVRVLLERGASKVYATARQLESLRDVVKLGGGRVTPIQLDINDSEQRLKAAAIAGDVTWLINNAGIPGSDSPRERRIRSASSLADARLVMETNCWSVAELSRLFIPIILANGGGAIVNVLSVGAWYCVPSHTTYSMSKAAAAMVTSGLRAELDRDPILVAGVFTAGVSTRMSAGRGVDPTEHAKEVFDALARGETDIVAGAGAARLRDEVRADPQAVERERIERFYASRP